MDKELALVSVCVITYNSSHTIIDTLDSIYNQSYPNVELVISDDCSSDNTVDICNQWLNAHRNRFEHAEIIICERNGGVAKNLNNAINHSNGSWIKTIAGDDLLTPDCIRDNMDFVNKNENQGVVFSRIRFFYDNEAGERVLTDQYMPSDSAIKYYGMSAEAQYHRILSCCFTPSNSVFLKRSLAVEYPFPEQYPYNEDDPHWLHLTKAGIKLCYFDKLTVLYRVGESLSRTGSKNFVNANHHYSKLAYLYSERYFELLKIDPERALELKKEFFLGDVAIVLLDNRRNLFTRTVLFFIKLLVGTRIIA